MVAAAVVALNDKLIAGLILVAALLFLATSLLIALRRFRRRAWILVAAEGFVHRDRNGESSYTDDQVVGLNVISKPNYREGVLKSYANEIEFKLAARPAPIKLQTTTKVDEIDPLAGLLHRVIEDYRQRAEAALDAGARLGGDGWSVGRDDLTVEGKDSSRVAIADLAAIETIDREHRIWKVGQDEPMLSVPIKSENAFLLTQLLTPKIEAVNQDREFDLTQPGLGRQIFRRSTGRFGRGFAWLCILFSLLAIPLLVLAAIAAEPTLIAISIAALFLAPCALLLGLFLLRSEFRCHERGVYQRGLLKKRELRFEDVESFKYAVTRQYYNGVYMGTALEIAFYPTASLGKKKLRYIRMVKNTDEALERLRDHVAQILAPKLAMMLNSTGSVQWIPNVRLTHEGLYYRPKGFISRKDEQLLRFADVAGFNVEEGTFHVWKHGVNKSVIHEPTSEPNFFSGYDLLTSLYWAASRAAASEEPA